MSFSVLLTRSCQLSLWQDALRFWTLGHRSRLLGLLGEGVLEGAPFSQNARLGALQSEYSAESRSVLGIEGCILGIEQG